MVLWLLSRAKIDLRPYHVVTHLAFRPLVLEAIQTLRSKDNVRLRLDQCLAIVPDDAQNGLLVAEHTFLKVLRPESLDQEAPAVQSAPPDAISGNPRLREVIEHS